ncbi:MAG TPA: prepilin-type N-terminal cleavage/methylation domain-containing protein [Phycisphaerae bacterium]|nr:prepilin-type N-terminal cleavage/methylation domain-containing protein [Phycisphaerae bacterium]
MRHAIGTHMRAGRTGFTLIEILVVVSIIALLIAILLPSLKKVRDNAKLTVCKTNLHDMGIAFNSYAAVNNGWFPPTPYVGSTLWEAVDNPAADDNLFVLWYAKFILNPAVLNCPATTHRIRTPDRIEQVPTSLGIKFIIRTAGSTGHVNDFERLAQYEGTGGFGTSYERGGWYYVPGARTDVNSFYHAKVLKPNGRYMNNAAPYKQIFKTTGAGDSPWRFSLLSDADDADWMAQLMGFRGITGSNGNAHNNDPPDPWDNHGVWASNRLFAGGHVTTTRFQFGKALN